MYKVVIEEFNSNHQYQIINNKEYINTVRLLYEKKGNSWCSIDIDDFNYSVDYISFFADECWHIKPPSDNEKAVRVPLTSYDYVTQKFLLPSGAVFFSSSHQYAGTARINEERVLCLGSLTEALPSAQYPGSFFPEVAAFQSKIIIRGRRANSALFCFDQSLNKIWQTPLKNYSEGLRGLRGRPQLFDNIIYLNMPERVRYEQHPTPMNIGAFSADTGKPLWEETLPICVRNADLFEDKVYIASEAFLQIRDVRTGEVVWSMEPFWHKEEIPCNLIPLKNSDLLVNFQFQPLALILDYNTKEIKQAIRFPEDSNYCFSTLKIPQKLNENSWVWSTEFQDFTDNARNSGLVFLEFDESLEEKDICANVKPRPNHNLTYKLNDKSEREYHLTMGHDNLDDIVRYCIIIIKNLAHDKGCTGLPNNSDVKHNGDVYIHIEKKRIQLIDNRKEDVLKKLSLIKIITENALNAMGFKAGNNKNTFRIYVDLV